MNSIFTTPKPETHELVAEFTVTGEPISKSRARFTKRGSKTFAYTPQKTLDGETAIKAAYLSATHKIGTDKDAAFAVRAHFFNGTRQRRDVDNMVKLVLDGLNEVAWPDDNQVLEIAARKSFVPKSEARTVVQVFLIGDMEFPKRPCVRCGAEFRTYDSWESDPRAKKYCSKECFHARIQERATRKCEQCGCEFVSEKGTSTTRYCSKECGYAGRRSVTNCAICTAEFSIQNCHLSDRNYCSPECIKEHDRIVHKERRSKYFPGTCGICGAGTTRKEYKRCNPCKLRGAKGKPAPKVDIKPRIPRACSEDSCESIARSRGMCGMHYTRWYRINNPTPGPAKLTLTIKEIHNEH